MFCLYPHQTAYVVPAGAVSVVPEGVPPARAVLAGTVETAINALWDAAPPSATGWPSWAPGWSAAASPGCCGGIPPCEVTLVDVDPGRADVAAALGVDFALPQDAAGDLDLVVHTSTTSAGLQRSLDLLAAEGTVSISAGTATPRSAVAGRGVPRPPSRHPRRARSGRSPRPAPRAGRSADRLALALELLRDPAFDALLTGESRFDELPDVMARLAAGSLPALCHTSPTARGRRRVQRDRPGSHDDRPQPAWRDLRAGPEAPRRDVRRRRDVPARGARRRRRRRRHRPCGRGAARRAGGARLPQPRRRAEPRRREHDDGGSRPPDRGPARGAHPGRRARRRARDSTASSSRCTSRPSPPRPTSVRCERRPLHRPRRHRRPGPAERRQRLRPPGRPRPRRGWLDGARPRGSRIVAVARRAVARHAAVAVGGIPDGALVLLDGLVASPAPEVLVPEAGRLRLVVLVHMPLGRPTSASGKAPCSRLPRPSSPPAPGPGGPCWSSTPCRATASTSPSRGSIPPSSRPGPQPPGRCSRLPR